MDNTQAILGNENENVFEPRTALYCVGFVVMAGIIWLCVPPMIWDISDDDDHEFWFFDDFEVKQDECKEVLRNSNLSFRVREEDFLHKNNSIMYEDRLDSTSFSIPFATDELSQVNGRALVHNAGKSFVDIESGEISLEQNESPDGVRNHCGDGIVNKSDGSNDINDLDDTMGDGSDDMSDSGVVLKIPVSMKNTIESSYINTVPIVCAICLENFRVDDELAFSSNVKCNHVFHIDCIARCIEKTKGAQKPCPCCRQCFFDAVELFEKDTKNITMSDEHIKFAKNEN